MSTELHEDLTGYLTDAHSIERQALRQLERAPDVAGDPDFARLLRAHFHETERHEGRVRSLLEDRDAAPSRVKDAVMEAGGKGFVLFARTQTDTSGKLAAHSYSYEALEWAAYDLLMRTAERLGEDEVVRVARSIRDEERETMERIEGVFDRTARASLQEAEEDPETGLRRYLAEAHALEEQSIQLLESGQERVSASVAAVFADHLEESKRQRDRIEGRMEELGAERSLLKDTAMRIGALNWGMFFRFHPDTAAKLGAFAYAFEHLEIGGYEQLTRVARMAGDDDTERVATGILDEERRAAVEIRDLFDEVARTALAEKSG